MPQPKVGLVLGGGGGKGAYQVGVYRALVEHGYASRIQAISGTSIGALNLTVFATNEVDTAVSIWRSLKRRQVLTLKPMKDYLKRDQPFSFFSRDGMLRIFSTSVDLSQVSACRIPLWVGTTQVEGDCGVMFSLNGKSIPEMEHILMASSAIPKAFDPVRIEGKTYYDGFKYLNVPLQSVIDEGCNLIFTVPLSEYGAPHSSTAPQVTIIDFKDPNFVDVGYWSGTFGFDQELAEERIQKGYEYAHRLLTLLEEEGVFAWTWRQRVRQWWRRKRKQIPPLRTYYSLEDIGVVHVPKEPTEHRSLPRRALQKMRKRKDEAGRLP